MFYLASTINKLKINYRTTKHQMQINEIQVVPSCFSRFPSSSKCSKLRATATSISGVLFALPLLATSGISARRPVGVKLHVQLALASRQLIVLGLLFPAQRVPLNRHIKKFERKADRSLCASAGTKRSDEEKTCQPGPTHSASAKIPIGVCDYCFV